MKAVISARTPRRIARAALFAASAIFAGTASLDVAGAVLRQPAKTASTPFHSGALVPADVVPLDLVFSSTSHGYEIVKNDSSIYVAATTDSGRSWRVTSGTFSPSTTSPGPPNRLHLPGVTSTPAIGVNSTGTVYVYGVNASSIEVSADEGGTWERAKLPGTVEDIVSSGSRLTALVDGPQLTTGPHGHLPSPPPKGWLYTSLDGGRTWSERSTLPSDVGPYKVLVQPTTTVAYALAPGENNRTDGVFGGLARSGDGGSTWITVQQPCDVDAAPRFGPGAEFGATSADALWIVCGDGNGDGPGAITQVQRSTDGGAHWSLVAGTAEIEPWNHTNFPATAAVPPAGPTPTSLFASNDAWVVLSQPASLVGTTDGGAHWSEAAPWAVEAQGPRFVLDVGGTIEVRTDSELWQFRGGTWHAIASPGSGAK